MATLVRDGQAAADAHRTRVLGGAAAANLASAHGNASLPPPVQCAPPRSPLRLPAVTACDLDASPSSLGIRECPLANVVCDAWRAACRACRGADVALLPASALAMRDSRTTVPRGPITLGDVLNLLPPSEDTVVLGVTGSMLLQAIEASVGQWPHPHGGFLQVSGISFAFNGMRPAGRRVVQSTVLVGGAPLDLPVRARGCDMRGVAPWPPPALRGVAVRKRVTCRAAADRPSALPSAADVPGGDDGARGAWRARPAHPGRVPGARVGVGGPVAHVSDGRHAAGAAGGLRRDQARQPGRRHLGTRGRVPPRGLRHRASHGGGRRRCVRAAGGDSRMPCDSRGWRLRL